MAALKTNILRLLVVFFILAAGAAAAGAYVTIVEDSAFDGRRMRPQVSFEHDAHNEKAGIESCNTCHHFYENGEKRKDSDSVGMECSNCHYKAESGELELIRIYHKQCKSCHLQKNQGPVLCGQCHGKTGENP
ncbi:MAG: acidic tetraheme cytochrome c3 TmcA [Desulfosalsimonas sp.]